MTNTEGPVKFQMNEEGESIDNYLSRTGGDIKDYELALTDFKLNIANKRGLSMAELHEKTSIKLEIAKQIFIVATSETEGGND